MTFINTDISKSVDISVCNTYISINRYAIPDYNIPLGRSPDLMILPSESFSARALLVIMRFCGMMTFPTNCTLPEPAWTFMFPPCKRRNLINVSTRVQTGVSTRASWYSSKNWYYWKPEQSQVSNPRAHLHRVYYDPRQMIVSYHIPLFLLADDITGNSNQSWKDWGWTPSWCARRTIAAIGFNEALTDMRGSDVTNIWLD